MAQEPEQTHPDVCVPPMIASSHPMIQCREQDHLDVRALAGRLRPAYQAALLAWYRDTTNKIALRRMMQVIVQLQQACPEKGLWLAAGGVIEGLLDNVLEATTSVKLLLGQVERQFRRIKDAGPDDLRANPPADLIKDLLYYVARSESQLGAAVGRGAAPGDQVSDGAKHALLQMATEAVKKELVWTNKTLDEFARASGHPTPDDLRSMMEVLRRVSGALDMLGRWELRQRARTQAGVLDPVPDGGGILKGPRPMEVANTLLYVESLLGDATVSGNKGIEKSHKELPEIPGRARIMREEECHELSRAVIREVMVDMAQVKDDIMAFAREPAQYSLLNPVPLLLRRIIGALTMLSLRRPTTLLKAIYHYIRHELLGLGVAPTQDVLEIIADVLTSVEYFLETTVESRMNLDSLLDMAESNVMTLGYLIDRVDAMFIELDSPADLVAAAVQEQNADGGIELQTISEAESVGEKATEIK